MVEPGSPWTGRLILLSWLQTIAIFPSLGLLPGFEEVGSTGQAIACLGGLVVMIIITTVVMISYFTARKSKSEVAVEGCLFFFSAPFFLAALEISLWFVILYCILPTLTLIHVVRNEARRGGPR